jgi:hypothetical protein
MVISPEHPLVDKISTDENKQKQLMITETPLNQCREIEDHLPLKKKQVYLQALMQ